ncbi:UMP kinase [Candidatus Bathyarchaeota archaeon]|nr:MAG: UMP kinase [Candidatus Bathyarchaeota archaeon]
MILLKAYDSIGKGSLLLARMPIQLFQRVSERNLERSGSFHSILIYYIATARKLGGDESTCDLLGIQITRANAELVRLAIGSMASSKIPTTLSDLPHFVGSGKAVVMGGLQPGQSTNAVAALAAEITRAEILVNGTDVDGVYTEDPKKNPKAKLIRSVHVDKLLSWAMGGEVFAGRYELLDPLAIKIMQRARIPTRFVSLGDPGNIIAALQGKDIGTKVVYS